jgi:hypothetical protein
MANNPVLPDRQARELLRRQRRPIPVAQRTDDPHGLASELAEIRQMIHQHQVLTPVRMLITQNMAIAMMRDEFAGKNRKISNSRVDRWKVILRDGRWQETHQGLAFDTNGQLRDGQHRLTAIANTVDTAVYSLVTFGMDPKAFPAIDVGYKRTAAQNLAFDDVPHPEQVAAMVRFKYRIDHQGLTPDDELVHRLGREMAEMGDITERAVVCATKLRRDKADCHAVAAQAFSGRVFRSPHRWP